MTRLNFKSKRIFSFADRLSSLIAFLEEQYAPAKLEFECLSQSRNQAGELRAIENTELWVNTKLATAGYFVLFSKFSEAFVASNIHISVKNEPIGANTVALGHVSVGISSVEEGYVQQQQVFDGCAESLDAISGDEIDLETRGVLLDLMGRGALYKQSDGSLTSKDHKHLVIANPILDKLKKVTRSDPLLPDQIGRLNYWSQSCLDLLGISHKTLEGIGAERVKALTKGYSITISSSRLDLENSRHANAIVSLYQLLM